MLIYYFAGEFPSEKSFTLHKKMVSFYFAGDFTDIETVQMVHLGCLVTIHSKMPSLYLAGDFPDLETVQMVHLGRLVAARRATPLYLSHRMYLSHGLKKTTRPHNCQFIVYYY